MEWTVNGFREHDGKGMPVRGETMVYVKFRDEIEVGPSPASDFLAEGKGFRGNLWSHQDEWFDIVAYKEAPNENPS